MSIQLRRKRLADGRQSLYLDVYRGGQRQYEFLKLYIGKDKTQNKETLKLANSIRAKRELELQHSDHGFVPAFKKHLNFVDYFARLAASKSAGEKAWPNCLNHLRAFTGGSLTFSGVTTEWLEQFQAYVLTKVNPNTASTYISKIKTALRQAQRDRVIVSNPADGLSRIRKPDTQRIYLSLEEIQALATTPCGDKEAARAFLFACFAGLRLSDVERLEWRNVQDGKLSFRQQKTGGVEFLPLSEMALALLNINTNIRPMPTNKVFALRSRGTTYYAIREWAELAGLEKRVSFHVSRHSFAVLSLSASVDIYTLSKLLGHRSLQTTQIYAQIIDQRKQEAVAKLPKIKMSR